MLEKILRKKAAILDTCLIAKAKDYSHTQEYFDQFFSILKKYDCIPLIHDLITFEFFRGCKTQAHKKTKEEFLKLLSIEPLPVTKDDVDRAIVIANIYSNCNIPGTQISLVDCVNSALLERYGSSLVLVTTDINDYPLCLHDRFHVEVVDTKKEIINIGFFTFDKEAFRERLHGFESTEFLKSAKKD